MSSSESLLLTRWLYLRLLGLVHLSAFASYAVMILGLNGEHGIAPTAQMLHQLQPELGALAYVDLPTIEWFNCSDAFVQALPWIGVVASLLVTLGVLTGWALLATMLLWLSIVAGGGEFTQFQSDGMLVEATFLSLFIVPWSLFEPPWPVPQSLKRQRAPSILGIWLIRFMIFRLMLAAGLVKILSGDPTWADLTALQYHFETQPIPTPLAWYAHQLPHWLLKVFVGGMFFIECIAPFFVFMGKRARAVAAVAFTLLHGGIILTGNYTFLNYLTIVISLPLLDDSIVRRLLPQSLNEAINASRWDKEPGRPAKLFVKVSAGFMFFLAGSQLLCTVMPGAGLLQLPLVLLSPLNICNRYGLFAVMTTKRPEIVFQGSNDGKEWKTYEFLYKVSDDLKRPPPWVAPHMPRLDWRLWFAAMEPVEQNPWVFVLAQRMLEGEPFVMKFFSTNPFPDHPPHLLRALVYDYHFTDAPTKEKTGAWWRRDNERVYLPTLTLVDGKLAIVGRINGAQELMLP